jgi:hypothetical protein
MTRHFVVDSEHDRALLDQQIEHAMIHQPESVLVIQATRDNTLVGFLIAQNTGPFVWLAQAWSRPGNEYQVADEMWSRLLVWSAALGKSEIRAETKRSINPLYERFGFVEFSRTITRKIDTSILDHIARSMIHGKPVQVTEGNHSEQSRAFTAGAVG